MCISVERESKKTLLRSRSHLKILLAHARDDNVMADIETSHGVGSIQVTQNDILSHGIDIFEPTKLEKSIAFGREVMLYPQPSNNDGPFRFTVSSQSGMYMQLGTFRLYGRCKVTDAKGKDIVTATNPVGVVNIFPQSLFGDIRVMLNGTPVSNAGSGAQCYKQYMETILSYGQDARNGHLVSAMFEMDTADQFDNQARNGGFKKRLEWVADSRTFDWEMPLLADFLMADRFLPPGNSLDIIFHRQNNSNEFSLLMDPQEPQGQYKVEIVELKLYYRTVAMHPGVMSYHESVWREHPYIFPINRTELVASNVGVMNGHVHLNPVWHGILPKVVIVGMVDSRAYDGDITRNPWNLQHFGCTEMSLKVQNVRTPQEPYRPDFANKLFTREYNSVFQNAGIKITNEGNCITKELFAGGSYLQVFDLTPDNCGGFHQHSPEYGDLGIDIVFAKPLDNPITLLLYGIFDAEIQVDSQKRVVQAHAEMAAK